MAGTAIGGKRASTTNRKMYGNDFYKKIGSMGGSVKNKSKGFGANRELARKAGAKGGRLSKRGPTAPVIPKSLWEKIKERLNG